MSLSPIGTLAWSRCSGGSLSLKEHFTLTAQVLAPAMQGMAATWRRRGTARPLELSAIAMPDTPAVASALEELRDCAEPVVIEHSFRTYWWGAAFGQLAGLRHDTELLMVSCLLHDLGMTTRHHGHHPGCRCFAVDGAEAAADWATRFGWDDARRDALYEAISLHMNGHVPPEQGAEAHLLQQGASCDVVGARWYELAEEFRDNVLARHPRHGLNAWFTRFALKESRMRPASRTALLTLMGFPLFIALNPFDE